MNMDKPIRWVAVFGMLLFFGLMAQVNYVQGSEAESLRTDPHNARQYQDVFKQIIDRVEPAMAERRALTRELVGRLRCGRTDTHDLDESAVALVERYIAAEALHRDPDAASAVAPGQPAARIELF